VNLAHHVSDACGVVAPREDDARDLETIGARVAPALRAIK
jgi:hypothetical protein